MIERKNDGRVWNLKSGSTTFWNVDREDVVCATINQTPPKFTELPGGIITPRDAGPRADRSSGARKRTAQGGIYDRDLKLLPEFIEREIFEADTRKSNRLINPHDLSEDRLIDARRFEGEFIYLGIIRGHFGHFLLESLCRMWAILKKHPKTKLIMHGKKNLKDLPSHIQHIFDLLDLDVSRIKKATSTSIVENLIVPQSEFDIRWKGSASYAELFRELHERNSRLFPDLPTPEKVYLTRRQLKVKDDFDREKVVHNEDEVERLFSDMGFEIVAPEALPFHQQIAMFGGARQIAGLKGSALHTSLFNQRPNLRVIQLSHVPSINQCIIDGIKKFDGHDIACQSPTPEGGNVVDIEVVRAALGAM